MKLISRLQLRAVPVVIAAALSTLAVPAFAVQGGQPGDNWFFRHVGTFDVIAGNGSAVAEIIDVTTNNKQLIYTDADNEAIGFVGIVDPTNPVGQGTMDVGGEPTSLAILDPLVLVAINTSESFVMPSGKLLVIHRNKREIVAEFELGGQPDSIAISPDKNYAAIVIENERDEDLDEGLLPQLPSGMLLILDMNGGVKNWSLRTANLMPVADNAFEGTDLEPEYVDINHENEAVVTFQENNHLAVVDLVTGNTISQFSAGSVPLMNVDTKENRLIELNTIIEKRREPDGVTWIDHDSFATANEGDYEDEFGDEGGSRGFTVFNQDGTIEYESFEAFDHLTVLAGHYPDERSENKGNEPEAAEAGTYGNRNLLFIGSERANAVGVFDVTDGEPQLVQALPTGIGPEGLKAISGRNLFVASTESDEADAGIPTMVNIYRLVNDVPNYPQILSGPDGDGLPYGWVALSGLTGDPSDADTLYAVSDSFLSRPFIYTVDVSMLPAMITDRLEVTGFTPPANSTALDLEGIAVGPDGHFWLCSEGRADGSRLNLVLKVNSATGAVMNEFELPEEFDQPRNNGFEGLAVTGEAGEEIVYVAIQRAWPNEGDTDEVNTKIGRYDVALDEWTFVHYEFEPEGDGDWIGLSELTLMPDGTFVVIERDKGWGPSTGFNAELKAMYTVDLENAEFRQYTDSGESPADLVTVEKTLYFDALPTLQANSIWTAEKLEGFAVAADGETYLVTDNDGNDDATGETVFQGLGQWDDL
jgi:hypothetical protein